MVTVTVERAGQEWLFDTASDFERVFIPQIFMPSMVCYVAALRAARVWPELVAGIALMALSVAARWAWTRTHPRVPADADLYRNVSETATTPTGRSFEISYREYADGRVVPMASPEHPRAAVCLEATGPGLPA